MRTIIKRTIISAVALFIFCPSFAAPLEAAAPTLPFELKKPDGATLLVAHYEKIIELRIGGGQVVGQAYHFLYHVPGNTVPSEIVTAYESELAGLGFQTLEKVGSDAGALFKIGARCDALKGACGKAGNFISGFESDKNSVFIKKAPEGDNYVGIYTKRAEKEVQWKKDKSKDARLDSITYQPGDIMLMVEVVLPKTTTVALVKEDANFISQSLRDKGRVDLYGIYFDFNKSDIKPESRPVLEQITAVLKDNPTFKLRVVGHTDNVGGKEYNDTLSQARANAVVASLAGQFGVDKERLTAAGKGFSEPKASNDNEEGRAKNRRVELVKQ